MCNSCCNFRYYGFFPDRNLDDVDSMAIFRREGFGRQSISEKHKGHLDPKNLETYQKIKVAKEKSAEFYSGELSRLSALNVGVCCSDEVSLFDQNQVHDT